MSRNYKFYNPDGVYFISFAVVEWLDVFTHPRSRAIASRGLEAGSKKFLNFIHS
jgi:hypothetical protein